MILGVSPTKGAVVIAHTAGSGQTFAIKSITSIQFEAATGEDLTKLLQRLVVIFERAGKRRGSTIALLASSSGRFEGASGEYEFFLVASPRTDGGLGYATEATITGRISF